MPAIKAALMALLLLGVLCCTTSGGKAKPREGTLRGTIKIYGSEPHTWVGLETIPEGRVYALVPPEKAEEFRALQGRLLELRVRFQDAALPPVDGAVTPLSWKQRQPRQL